MSGLPLIRKLAVTSATRFSPIEYFTAAVPDADLLPCSARIARTDITFDLPMPIIDAVAAGRRATQSLTMPASSLGEPTIVGSGWLGQALRGFKSWSVHFGQRVKFDDGAGFDVSTSGDRVDAFELPADIALRDELLLGPALMLALANRRVFGLHASAILGGDGAVLLLGPSGSGKSTLARHAIEEGGLRLSDDVTPVHLGASGIRVLPRFPQLKLTPALIVDDLELAPAALVWVTLGMDGPGLQQMAAGEATRCLVRDSVAARLFLPDLLARHFEFCAALAGTIPAFRLTLPRVADARRAATVASAYALLRSVGLP